MRRHGTAVVRAHKHTHIHRIERAEQPLRRRTFTKVRSAPRRLASASRMVSCGGKRSAQALQQSVAHDSIAQSTTHSIAIDIDLA